MSAAAPRTDPAVRLARRWTATARARRLRGCEATTGAEIDRAYAGEFDCDPAFPDMLARAQNQLGGAALASHLRGSSFITGREAADFARMERVAATDLKVIQ